MQRPIASFQGLDPCGSPISLVFFGSLFEVRAEED
jgi:hypothetical protein